MPIIIIVCWIVPNRLSVSSWDLGDVVPADRRTSKSESDAVPKQLRRVEFSSLTAKDVNHSSRESTGTAEYYSSSELEDISSGIEGDDDDDDDTDLDDDDNTDWKMTTTLPRIIVILLMIQA